MITRKTVAALSVAALAATTIALPAAAAGDRPVQLAACSPKKACNPCAAKKACNPCAPKANPCAAKANPCAAKGNPCAPKK
jgi:hypothetical protein